MPKRSLTAAAVERLKPPATGQVDHFDKGYPGLALRISHGGRKAWTYFYRLYGKQRRLTLGTFPAMTVETAHDAWRAARDQVGLGIDPAAAKAEVKAREPDTVRKVGGLFIEKWHRPRNRTADEVARMFALYLYPALGHRDIGSITRRDILEVMDKVEARRSGAGANRVLANLRRLFGWAVERGYVDASPVDRIKAPAPEMARNRVLSDDEIFAFLRACERLGDPFGQVFKLLLLTGQRRDEVGAAAWIEFDLSEKVWRLPAARTKNGREHIVPLPRQALALIEALPSHGNPGLLFPARFARDERNREVERPVSGYGRAKERLDRRMRRTLRALARVRGEDGRAVELTPFRLHDLRRTCASGMARLGVAIHVTEKLLNHVSGTHAGIVGVYQVHEYADEKRAAAQMWADFVDGLMSRRPANVIALAQAR